MPAGKGKSQKLEESLAKQCHFKKHVIKCLCEMYNRMTEHTDNKMLDRTTLRETLHKRFEMTDDIILDRIYRAFDCNSDGKVDSEDFVKGMSIFLHGNMEERMKFCFNVYDLNSDGFIQKEEMYNLLKTCLPQKQQDEDPEEGTRDLVDLVLKKLDKDGDGRVSVEDFSGSVGDDDLLLECLGPCFPNPKLRQIFVDSLEEEAQY